MLFRQMLLAMDDQLFRSVLRFDRRDAVRYNDGAESGWEACPMGGHRDRRRDREGGTDRLHGGDSAGDGAHRQRVRRRHGAADGDPVQLRQYLEWSGTFEHQVRAQKTLRIVFPAVIATILIILYLTHKSWINALLLMTNVLGALAGGAIFQWLFGFKFSEAWARGPIAPFETACRPCIGPAGPWRQPECLCPHDSGVILS